jgi:SAM-dependent methyltransferase
VTGSERYDYGNYGAFKDSYRGSNSGALARIARALGFRNRYLRFLRSAERDKLVLEIGCGNGEFLDQLLLHGFTRVHGVDPSPTFQPVVDPHLITQQYASEYLHKCSPASIGAVVALDVFEHIHAPELRDLLVLIYDRLLPSGVVMFRVPNMASSTALANYFGDLSHRTALTEVSIRQLVFQLGFTLRGIYPEPFAYPRSLATLLGILTWPFYRTFTRLILSAFGIRPPVLTPNLVCVLVKPPVVLR